MCKFVFLCWFNCGKRSMGIWIFGVVKGCVLELVFWIFGKGEVLGEFCLSSWDSVWTMWRLV